MSPPPRFRLSFNMKVLLPAVAMMALLAVAASVVIHIRVTRQLRADAGESLYTARNILENYHRIRSRELLIRCRAIPNDPRFKAVAQLGELRTIRELLRELVEETDVDFLIYTHADGSRAVAFRAGRADTFTGENDRIAASVTQALEGEAANHTLVLDSRIYDLASAPVEVGSHAAGAVSAAMEIDDSVALELSRLTRCEVAFLAGPGLPATSLNDAAERELGAHVTSGADRFSEAVSELRVSGEHYLELAGALRPAGNDIAPRYILLSSYEPQLRELRATHRVLVLLSLATILLSGVGGWLFIRRLTRPLDQLSAGAEAVGRGDFTRNVEALTNDEFGDVAAAFNRMTESLRTSRDSLEETVKTLRETRARLLQSEKLSAMGEFIAGVAHELNNPLTVMVGFSELLAQANLDKEDQASVQEIAESADRCRSVVQNLLSFARQQPPQRQLVIVSDLLDKTVRFLHYELRTSNIEVQTDYDDSLPPVTADPHQLQQVFLNLVNNARQAIEEAKTRGVIRLRTGRNGENVCIEVEDNGPGIPPSILDKIFDPFFTTKEPGKGTGLGLSVSYGIIQEHRGEIRVDSQVGHGTRFTIDLPMAGEESRADAGVADVAPSPQPAVTGRGRALVVDDEPGVLNLVERALRSAGYLVQTVRDGFQALRLMQHQTFDLVLCDWKMPGLTGQQVHEQVREAHPDLAGRFVFMTGDTLNDHIARYTREHGLTLLAKPFSLVHFRAAVQTLEAAGRLAG